MHSGRFFLNDTATTEIYTLSLRDALPICIANLNVLDDLEPSSDVSDFPGSQGRRWVQLRVEEADFEELRHFAVRSEEHTSELQSRQYLVCRLLLEKKHTSSLLLLILLLPS